MSTDFVSAEVLVVDVLDLEGLRRRVLVLADEFLGELAPHQRFGFGVGAEVVAAFVNDARVEFVEVDVSDADFGFGFEGGAVQEGAMSVCESLRMAVHCCCDRDVPSLLVVVGDLLHEFLMFFSMFDRLSAFGSHDGRRVAALQPPVAQGLGSFCDV